MEPTQTTPCANKVRLIQEFHETTLDYSKVVEAVLAYSKVVSVLPEWPAILKQEEYGRIDGAIDRVRRKYESSRDHLTRHIVEHGC
jgi:hypothetical protein